MHTDEKEAENEADEEGSVSNYKTLCAFFSIMVILLVACFFYGPMKLLHLALHLLPKNPGWYWYVSWGTLNLLSIVCMLPMWPPMSVAAGLMFGFVYGTILNFYSVFGASVISIALGRSILQEPVRRWLHDGDFKMVNKMLKALEESEESLKFMILFRFLYIPLFVRNYGPSTLRISFWKLAVSCIPHSIWVAIVFCSLGLSLKDASELVQHGEDFSLSDMRWQNLAVFVVSAIMSALLSYFAYNWYKEHCSEEAEALVPKDDEAARA